MLSKIRSFFGLVRRGNTRQALLATYVDLLQVAYRLLPHDGVEVVSEEWDTLVVLDACRYDYYAQVSPLDGNLQKRRSLASATSEWLHANFQAYHDDIVYVSANPRISDEMVDGFRGTDHFHEVVNVWRTDWNEDLNTVEPSPVTKAAIRARQDYPDKRLIVHYIQPHAPWIGNTELSDRDTTLSDPDPDAWIETGKTWGTMLNDGKPNELVRRAYVDNLELVLSSVTELISELDERIVVTSDHGECFGEKHIIEHPEGVYVDELVEVPWHVVGTGVTDEERESEPA